MMTDGFSTIISENTKDIQALDRGGNDICDLKDTSRLRSWLGVASWRGGSGNRLLRVQIGEAASKSSYDCLRACWGAECYISLKDKHYVTVIKCSILSS